VSWADELDASVAESKQAAIDRAMMGAARSPALTASEWAIARRAWLARSRGRVGLDVLLRAMSGADRQYCSAERLDILVWRYRAAVTNSASLD
jgi:hypothetical protein